MDKGKDVSGGFKYIYGPVSSWRLGRSLGIDLLSQKDKICDFDCVYCQLGKTMRYTTERKIFVPTNEVIKEIKTFPENKVDFITFSGRGEPTLAKNLGEVISEVKKIRSESVAVLTNSLMISRPDVRKDLSGADFVSVKLDSFSEESFKVINKPPEDVKFEDVLEGIKEFRRNFKKKLALQIMFVDENKLHAPELAALAESIQPDEVEINTPLRSSASKALSKEELEKIGKEFSKMKTVMVYNIKPKSTKPMDIKETLKRRP